MAEAATKAASTAKKTTAKTADTAASNVYAFADAGQTAFKETFERSMSTFGDMSESSKESMDAMIASFTAASQGAEKLNANVVAYTKKSMETSMEAAKSLASAKSVQEVIELQADYAKSSMDAYMKEMTKAADLMSTMFKDSWKPINERAVSAMDTMQAMR